MRTTPSDEKIKRYVVCFLSTLRITFSQEEEEEEGSFGSMVGVTFTTVGLVTDGLQQPGAAQDRMVTRFYHNKTTTKFSRKNNKKDK